MEGQTIEPRGLWCQRVTSALRPKGAGTLVAEKVEAVDFENLGRKVVYSITSVARSSTLRGNTTPSARAVRRLTTKSYTLGCSTGMSAGFAPRRIRSTSSAVRRNKSRTFTPYDNNPPT